MTGYNDHYHITPPPSLYCNIPCVFLTRLQEPSTWSGYGIMDLHDKLMCIILLVVVSVTYLLVSTQFSSYLPRIYVNDRLEFVWTLVPISILWVLAIQSIDLLYSMDEVYDPELSVSITGYQWYWMYNYQDWDAEPIESRLLGLMGTVDELKRVGSMDGTCDQVLPVSLQNLRVDNPLVLPCNTNVRLLVTSSDVLHSFAVPSFGVKMDAVPGRINMISTHVHRIGTYFGQCSELCGVMHGFMPIEIHTVESL